MRTDVTRILSAIEQGDPSAAEGLLPLVHNELRKLAAKEMTRQKPGQRHDVRLERGLIEDRSLSKNGSGDGRLTEQPRPERGLS